MLKMFKIIECGVQLKKNMKRIDYKTNKGPNLNKINKRSTLKIGSGSKVLENKSQ